MASWLRSSRCLMKSISPRSLNEIGVPADCTQRIAEKALLDSAAGDKTPENANVAEMRDIIENRHHKKHVRNTSGPWFSSRFTVFNASRASLTSR